MYKIVALWGAPKNSDVEAFEKYYRGVHVPLARKVPGLKKLVLTRTDAGLEGAKSAFYRVAELYFENRRALAKSEKSPQWQAMREDGRKMVERFKVSLTASQGVAKEETF
jgi:uncharacterized protein (TIGR02118 family)